MSLLIFSEIFTIFEITKLMLTHHCKLILSNKYSQYILINTLQNTEIFQTNSVIIIDPLTGVNAGEMMTPDMGKPLPMPLATLIKSGRMPNH